jgi:hypothetical protein
MAIQKNIAAIPVGCPLGQRFQLEQDIPEVKLSG